jgi:hypothetical protein
MMPIWTKVKTLQMLCPLLAAADDMEPPLPVSDDVCPNSAVHAFTASLCRTPETMIHTRAMVIATVIVRMSRVMLCGDRSAGETSGGRRKDEQGRNALATEEERFVALDSHKPDGLDEGDEDA